jgi:hypothetical protein
MQRQANQTRRNMSEVNTIPQRGLRSASAAKPAAGISNSGFFIESNFYPAAPLLRERFERQLHLVTEAEAGITDFKYTFSVGAYQFLTAAVDNFLSGDELHGFIDSLRAWAAGILGTSHVSTPQARMFLAGCERKTLKDEVAASWHYIFSLTRERSPARNSIVTVVSNGPRQAQLKSRINEMFALQLPFNQLLVHRTDDPYRIDFRGRSMDPREGLLLLDGYFW